MTLLSRTDSHNLYHYVAVPSRPREILGIVGVGEGEALDH